MTDDRAAFEKWAATKGLPVSWDADRDDYLDGHTAVASMAWHAGKEAGMREQREKDAKIAREELGKWHDADRALRVVEDAIRQQGE